MTRTEFQDQWSKVFAPLTGQPMPSYDEFRISERMLEDYLDIFRGYNSRDGEILMPYVHPFFDSKGNPLLDVKPCIKYILIGEARPKQNDPRINVCNGDEANTFFYNINHVGVITRNATGAVINRNPTPWLNAPRINWGSPSFQDCPSNKVQTLLSLAANGVLLLDLFPFAILYGALRPLLCAGGFVRFYWDNPVNAYSLLNRILLLAPLLSEDWDLSLIAPCTISEHIINPINVFPPLLIPTMGLHPAQFRTTMPDPTRCTLGGYWRKIAVSSAGAPTANLINISF